MGASILAAAVGLTRRLPCEAAVEVALAATVFLFALGSSSSHVLSRLGGPGRWAALLLLCALSLACAAANGRRPSSVPRGWILAAALVAVGVVSAAWSVAPRLTVERVFTLGVLFVTAVALALAGPDPRVAAARVLRGVLGGIAAVAVGSLMMLVVAHRDAVLSATAGAGWRFRGLGENPNTVSMLLAVGLPLAVWLGFARRRALGAALVLLFAGEIAVSGSRGAVVAGFGGALLTALVLGPTVGAKLALAAGLVVVAGVCVATSRLQHPAGAVAVTAPAGAGAVVKTRGIDANLVLRLEDELGHPPLGGYRPPVARTLLGSSGRAQAWAGAAQQAGRRPLLGYGFGTEDRVFVDRFYAFEGGFPENSYLGTFLQLGAAGVALLVGLLLTLAWNAYRVLRRGKAGPAAAAAGVLLVAILIGVSQSGITSVGNIAVASIWVCALTLPALAEGRA
jgi:O-antigen ligase